MIRAWIQRISFGTLAACATLSVAEAQLRIEITQGDVTPIPIAIVPFGAPGASVQPFDVAAVVEGDLKRSGLFAPVARKDMAAGQPTRSEDVAVSDWKVLRTDYVVVGQVQPQADGSFIIQFEVVNILTGQKLLAYRQPANKATFRAASHRIADLIFKELTGIPGAFSTRIAYVFVNGQVPKRNYQLIVADADGENRKVIAASNQPLMSPAWSPDAQSLAYVSFDNRVASIIVQKLNSGERRRVSARAGVNGSPAFSPDGQRLALTLSQRDGNLDVYVLKLSDQTLTRITTDDAIDTEAVWAPDGRTLYFTSDRSGNPQIYRVTAAAGERPQRITFEGGYNARARVSPDGKLLAVITREGGNDRIGVVDLKTNNLRVLTKGRDDESPSFAPNGAVLIYGTQDRGRGLLATVSADGRVQQRLAAEGGSIQEPVWSPFPP